MAQVNSTVDDTSCVPIAIVFLGEKIEEEDLGEVESQNWINGSKAYLRY